MGYIGPVALATCRLHIARIHASRGSRRCLLFTSLDAALSDRRAPRPTFGANPIRISLVPISATEFSAVTVEAAVHPSKLRHSDSRLERVHGGHLRIGGLGSVLFGACRLQARSRRVSEEYLQSELNLPSELLWCESADGSKYPGPCIEVPVRLPEVHVVERVEQFGAELQPHALCEPEVLEYAGIELEQARPDQDVASEAAEREGRRLRECA